MRFGGFARLLMIAVGLAVVWATPVAAADAVAGLDFSAPDSLKLERGTPPTNTEAVTIWLRNTSSQAVSPSFAAQAEDKDGKPLTDVVVAPESGGKFAPLPANRVLPYRLVFRNVDKSKG